jgi:8-oxo-dGTP diphosphatase
MSPSTFALSVKAAILDNAGCCLLLKRSSHARAYSGKWDFPGGKAEPNEKFDQALLRETREETGLEISLQSLAGAVEFEINTIHVVCIIMEAHVEPGDVHLSREHQDFTWVALQELPNTDLVEPLLAFSSMYSRSHT